MSKQNSKESNIESKGLHFSANKATTFDQLLYVLHNNNNNDKMVSMQYSGCTSLINSYFLAK